MRYQSSLAIIALTMLPAAGDPGRQGPRRNKISNWKGQWR